MDKLGSKKIEKIIVVVDNIEEAVEYYAKIFNIEKPSIRIPADKPPVVEGGKTPYAEYRGEKRQMRIKTAIIPLEPIYLELAEPYDEPSPWTEFKQKHGHGMAFLSFYVDGFEENMELMSGLGMPAFHKQEKGKERYAYFDSEDKIGTSIEIKEFDKK